MTYLIENHTGNKQYYTKQEVWQWLKAEMKWKRAVEQWLRAEGVPRHVLMERRHGRPEAPRYKNRAAKRAQVRSLRRGLKKAFPLTGRAR